MSVPHVRARTAIKPYPNKGARQLHSRTSMFYTAYGVTPAQCMRLTGVGSQYILVTSTPTANPSTVRRPTG